MRSENALPAAASGGLAKENRERDNGVLFLTYPVSDTPSSLDAIIRPKDAITTGQNDVVFGLAFLPPDGNTPVTRHEVRLWRAPSWDEIEAAEKGTEGKAR
jgi:hypothetical protein